MIERITPRQFYSSDGIEDWRVLSNGACAHFRTGSFASGVQLVEAIGQLADAANHHPDVDLRYARVTVRLSTHEVSGLSRRDVDLAREITSAARQLGFESDPKTLQDIQMSIDALDGPTVLQFWQAVLGYRKVSDEDLLDPLARGPSFSFPAMEVPRTVRNRVRVNVIVPHDVAAARVAAALAAGGHLVTGEHAPAWWVLADAEGNEACVASWMGRD